MNAADKLSQFDAIFDQRVATLKNRNQRPQQRWGIWRQQAASEQRICFATCARDTCEDRACPWRQRCQRLQAEWQR